MKLIKTINVMIIGMNDYIITSRKDLINRDEVLKKLHKCNIETVGAETMYRKRKVLCREVFDNGKINHSPIIADVPVNTRIYNEDFIHKRAKVNQYLLDEEKNRYYYELILE